MIIYFILITLAIAAIYLAVLDADDLFNSGDDDINLDGMGGPY